MPLPSSAPHLALPVLLLLGAPLAGCGPESGAPPPAAERSASSGGVVLAVRPVVPRGAVDAGGLVEITVRGEAGREVQVIQPREGGLKPGDRVAILPGSPTRLVAAP